MRIGAACPVVVGVHAVVIGVCGNIPARHVPIEHRIFLHRQFHHLIAAFTHREGQLIARIEHGGRDVGHDGEDGMIAQKILAFEVQRHSRLPAHLEGGGVHRVRRFSAFADELDIGTARRKRVVACILRSEDERDRLADHGVDLFCIPTVIIGDGKHGAVHLVLGKTQHVTHPFERPLAVRIVIRALAVAIAVEGECKLVDAFLHGPALDGHDLVRTLIAVSRGLSHIVVFPARRRGLEPLHLDRKTVDGSDLGHIGRDLAPLLPHDHV